MIELERLLQSRIRESGPITYEEFIEVVLYDQGEGYYRNGKPDRRDFLTSPEVHVVFGGVIANYVLHLANLAGSPRFSILELGGGSGRLARAVISNLPSTRLDRYVVLEKARKKERGFIEWVDGMEELPFFDGFTFVIANEFFDALPFHRVVMLNSKLREIYLGFVDGFTEIPQPLSPGLATFLNKYPVYLNEHQTLEVTVALETVATGLSSKVGQGAMLVFDYGYHLEDIALGALFDGSMVSYHDYVMSPEVFSELGRRDISHHVNFDHLSAILEKAGWRPKGEKAQYRFLNTVGMGNRIQFLPSIEQRAARMLIDPDGMGSVFRTLGFTKGVSVELPGF